MVLHCAYSSSVQMMAVFVVFTPCFRRTYCLHLKGEWLSEGGCKVVKWKKTSVWGKESVQWQPLKGCIGTYCFYLQSDWTGSGRRYVTGWKKCISYISEHWGNLAVHSCHPITAAPAWPNSVNLQTQATYYSEMLEQTRHTTFLVAGCRCDGWAIAVATGNQKYM